MKILALERENSGFQPEVIAPFLKAEARKVWELRQRKIIGEMSIIFKLAPLYPVPESYPS